MQGADNKRMSTLHPKLQHIASNGSVCQWPSFCDSAHCRTSRKQRCDGTRECATARSRRSNRKCFWKSHRLNIPTWEKNRRKQNPLQVLSHIRLTLTASPSNRNCFLHGRLVLVPECRTKTKSVRRVRPVSEKLIFKFWAPSLFFWIYHICSFIYGYCLHKLLIFN
jgi:hypothetical protein